MFPILNDLIHNNRFYKIEFTLQNRDIGINMIYLYNIILQSDPRDIVCIKSSIWGHPYDTICTSVMTITRSTIVTKTITTIITMVTKKHTAIRVTIIINLIKAIKATMSIKFTTTRRS